MSSLAEAIFLNKPRGEKEENTWENEEEIFCALLAFFFTAYAKNVIQKNFSNTFSQKNAETTTTFRYLKLKASLLASCHPDSLQHGGEY